MAALDLVDQDAAGQEPVEGLGAFLLALDLGAGGEMLEVDAGRDLVDVLAAVAARADEFLDDVLFADAELLHPLRQGLLFIGADAEYRHVRMVAQSGKQYQFPDSPASIRKLVLCPRFKWNKLPFPASKQRRFS